MKLPELMHGIKTKSLPHMVVFVGTEYAIINEYLDQMEKRLGLEKYSINSACTVLTANKVMSLTKQPRLYVCRYDKQILTSEKNWAYVKNLGDNYLVLIFTQLDKRGKFAKQFEDVTVEFVELNADTVKQMIGKKVTLPEKYLDRLLLGCENNYGRCLLEIQKIKSIAEEDHCTDEEAYKKLLRSGVIYEAPQVQIQEFVRQVMEGDYGCFSTLNELKKNNESAFVLIAWLYNNIRAQLIVQTLKKVSTETTGLNYYMMKECLDRKGYYSVKELLTALSVIKRVEQGLKNGIYEESWAMEYILINIL